MSARAMFPLGVVLFPGVGLPLRIFEPRYRTMLRTCLERDESFGIVLIAAGQEVGGHDERFDLGTMARIVDAQVQPDGQASIVVVGTERFRVERWLPDDPYPIADVTAFDDTDDVDADAVASMVRRVRRMLARRSELNLPAPPATVELADDPTMALWQCCALLPNPMHDNLALLATPSAVARLQLLGALLDDYDAELDRLLRGPEA